MTSRSGFSLIEVVVALGVFALGATALMQAASENARTVRALEEKTLAGMIAENLVIEAYLEDALPPMGAESGVVENAGREWEWRRIVSDTPVPDVFQIEMEVRLSGSEQVLDSRTLFRAPR